MEFAKRLKMLRLGKNMTQKDLAETIGVSAATVQFWESGAKNPSMKAIISLSEALCASADTLLGLRDVSFPINFALNWAEKNLVDDFRALDAHGKRLVQTVCKIERSRISSSSGDNRPEPIQFCQIRSERYIPRYTTPSAAGVSVPLDGSDFEMMLVTDDVPSDADCAVNIQGESMAPYIHDGDMVFVKKDVELAIGDVGIFCVDGAMYCKQYYVDEAGNLTLVSANPELRHTNVRISADGGQSVSVYGKVLLGYKIDLPPYLFE